MGSESLRPASGAEALQTLELVRGSIKVLVTDIMMPRMTGAELIERCASVAPGLRVIVMSGYADSTVADLNAVGDMVLHKPFPAGTLIDAVRTLSASR